MPIRAFAPAVDPVFAEVTKAIYGDVDPRELLSKFSPGGSDLHTDRPMTPKDAEKQKKLAISGLAATGVAAAGGVHAIKATMLENKHRAATAAGKVIEAGEHKPGLLTRLGSKVHLKPTTTAAIIGGGMLGLHAVELASDGLAIHAQTKQLRQAQAASKPKPNAPVVKAFRLRALNVMPDRVPSLRAKRPRRVPLTTKAALYQPVSKVEEVTWSGVFSKVDADKRQVFGWASVSKLNGEDVVDLQGDIVPIEETEKAAYRYVIESRKGGDMHKRVSKFSEDQPLHTADMIESFVVTPEKLEKMGLPADALPHGWWVGYHVNDDKQWEMVKSGERAGFSIHGSGKRTAVAKAYERGSITYHQEQADLHARKKAAAGRRVEGGLAAVPVGLAIAGGTHAAAPHVAQLVHRGNTGDHVASRVKLIRRVRTGGLVGGGALAAGGLAVAGHGAVARMHHGRQQNEETRQAQLARKSRNATRPGQLTHLEKLQKPDKDKAKLKPVERAGPQLKDRAHQAVHPPAVKLHPVKSSAVRSMGYQPQTKRLSYEMHSNPGHRYEYRARGSEAVDALMAPSIGHHYATKVRGKVKRAEGYTPADRFRLFVDPQED